MYEMTHFVIVRVRLVERGSPHSLPLMESGKVQCRITPEAFIVEKDLVKLSQSFVRWSSAVVDSTRSEGDHCQP